MSRTDTDQLAITIGKAIAKHRTAKKLTQEGLAELLGLGNEAVSRMERGTVMPTVYRLVELADIFQCNASDLLTEVSHRPSDQAAHLNALLMPMTQSDRDCLIEIMERLAQQLSNRTCAVV